MQNNHYIPSLEEDKIDLKKVFTIIGHYKWSIILFTTLITTLVAAKVYFMPKYYQSTITIEVKSEDSNSGGGFSMGGAAALLLGSGVGGSANLEKDITLLKTYRTNKKVLNRINGYMIRYFITNQNYKELEIDNNLSIEVSDVKIENFRNYGMRLIIKPFNKTEYQLLLPGRFSNTTIGTYHYSEMVTHKDFSLMIHKKRNFTSSYTIQFSGSNRFIYESIINKNLNIEADTTSPFLTLTFIDNLPGRGEAYLRSLIEIYSKQSINDIKNDTSLIMNSYDQQLEKVEQQVKSSSQKLEDFKTRNSIISPKLQAKALIQELSNVGIKIAQNHYKQELLNSLIKFAKNHRNIDAIAPSLIELQDEPTISLIKLIQVQQLALADLLLKYKVNHPTIVRADQTIYNLKSKVLSNLKNLKKTLMSKNISLKKMKQGYDKKLKFSPKEEQQLISFSRNYKINEKMYLFLMQERSAAQLTHDKAYSRFKVIESIYTSKIAIKPKKRLIVTITFVTSIILMLFITLLRDYIKVNKENNV